MDPPLTLEWRAGKFVLVDGQGASMIVNLAEVASNAMLDALASMMNDGGSIELLSDDQRLLAVLELSSPAAKVSADGELVFNQIAEGPAIEQGNAQTARILGSDGREVLSVDVGDSDSDAVIKFPSTQINQGAPVRLTSFKLAMP